MDIIQEEGLDNNAEPKAEEKQSATMKNEESIIREKSLEEALNKHMNIKDE
jgi:hypothetical protein